MIHKSTLTAAQFEEDFLRVFSFVRHHPEDGLIRWAGTPYPLMLVWSPRIYEFLLVLERVISYPPARGLCREVGYQSGFDGARESVRPMGGSASDPVGTLLVLPRMLAGAGWGLSEIVYDDERGDLQWTFPRGTAVGVAARAGERRTTPACAFIEGFGAGWVKASLGNSVEFLEVTCLAMGDETCTFESRPLG